MTLTVTNGNLSGNYAIDQRIALGPWEGAISMEKTKDVLNINELASYLDIPKSTIYKLVREGKIPAQKVGRHWRFHKETINSWLGNRNELAKP